MITDTPQPMVDGIRPALSGGAVKTGLDRYILAFSRWAVVFILLTIGAGNITNSFFLKWGFRDDQKSYSVENYRQSYSLVGMMYGESAKPFVYRSAAPRAIRWAMAKVPASLRDQAYAAISWNDSLHKTYFHNVPQQHWTQEVALTYHATYFLVVGTIFLLLLTVYRIARLHGLAFGQSLAFVAAFSLFYPLTFQQGGYYYDFIEQLGVLAVCYFALRRRLLLSTFAVLLFSFNKETFFLAPIALFFLTADRLTQRQRAGWLVAQLLCCAVGRYFITSGFQGNPGGNIETHWAQNLAFWLHPASFLLFYNLVGKGIYTPSLQNPIVLVPLAVFFAACWRSAPRNLRNYFHAAFWPLLLLFALFGYTDEARNFSLAFPAIMLIALQGVGRFDRIFAASRAGPASEPGTRGR